MRRSRIIRNTKKAAVLLLVLLLAGCGAPAGKGAHNSTSSAIRQTEGRDSVESPATWQPGEQAGVESPATGQPGEQAGVESPATGQPGEQTSEESTVAGQAGEKSDPDALPGSAGHADTSISRGETSDGTLRIGVAVYSLQNEYMKRFAASASEAAEKAGITLKIYDGNYDAGLQVTQIEEMIESGVDGILLNPEDADESAACVDLAQEAGVPVIAVNTRVNSDKIASYVGSDDEEAGRLLMQRVADALGGSGNVVILEGPIGQSAQRERLAGMKEILRKYPELKVISCKTANWSRLEARGVMEKWLGIFDQIDAVAAENDDMALGAADAVTEKRSSDAAAGNSSSDVAMDAATEKSSSDASAKKNSSGNSGGADLVIVGIDGSEDAVRAVENGQMTATIFQNAEAQGETAVQVMSELLQGNRIEKEYLIPFELIGQEGRTAAE
ncbi:MAG: substrate-binding domain-containing protein [Eubacterium sp.]|nr:substrate-binding domain-containing protein [Eubacterium sp.]